MAGDPAHIVSVSFFICAKPASLEIKLVSDDSRF